MTAIECIKRGTSAFDAVKDEMVKRAKELDFAPYQVGDRIGQTMFIVHPNVKIIECDSLSDTERGSGGFGSSGR